MEIRIKQTGQVMLEQEFRNLYPNTSFPVPLSAEVINEFGGDVVFEGPTPTATEYQVVSRDGVEQTNGQWYTKYKITDMTQEGIDAVNAEKSKNKKEEAARLLSESDFYDLPNTSVKIENIADILAYRDALRAIALNPTFDAVIPEKPETVWK